ncbi:MAG: hypothetical protein ABL927_14455 [Bdellovibrionales bacterium]
MSTLKVRKVGNSLGVIFSQETLEVLKVSENDIIDVTPVGNNKVVLDARLPHHSEWTFVEPNLSKEDKAWVDADLEDEDESPK